jgi:hypothetical protein
MSMRDIFHGGGEGKPLNLPALKFKKGLLVLLALLVFSTVFFPAFAKFYTDWLWFDARGFSAVFWKQVLPQWGLFLAASIGAFIILTTSWLLARKGAASLDIEGVTPIPTKRSGVIVVIVAFLISIMNGLGVKSQWDVVLRFLNKALFSSSDPIFGKNIAFYVFDLPFYSLLQDWLVGILITALLGSTLIFVLAWIPQMREQSHFSLPQKARRHLSVLGALCVASWGAGFWLERFNLLFSPQGVVFGAGYTDIHARLLGINVMFALSMIVAILLLVNIMRRTWKLAAVALVLLVASNIVIRGVYPGIVQKYVVEPNEYQKEAPYIQYNIESTLKAYGLDSLKTVDFLPANSVTWEQIQKEKETINNIRLWDYRPLLRTYKQLQEIRSYYDFNDIDIDRYNLGGSYRQVMLSARELDLQQLQNPTWVNMHLEFTHGYGVVMNPVTEIDPEGKPVFFIKDLPPRISVPLEIERPQIYYGEKVQPYVLVKTKIKEFDYPMGGANVRTTYEGTGGVAIGSIWRRLAFAVRFRDSQILFTDAILPESRIMFYRSIGERVRKVAPFLLYDNDPYLTIMDGKLVWVQDAYTATNLYPYSEPVSTPAGRINYIRNSVKVTVDAYNGEMNFYIADTEDPLVKSWAKIFPTLFKPMDEAPASFRKHIRYPKGLFLIQSEIFRTYHMKDTNTFYNKEDVWELPRSGKAGSLNAYYVIMKLAGEERAEFMLIAPFTPVGRDNMIAWIAGRSDGDNYGELLVYQFPKQKLIYGPTQVEALIDQDPEISAQLSLWSQRGSDVIRGNLLVIPTGDSLLYVQPLYLRAENSDLPELKRVIVSSGGRVAWGERLEEALTNLLGPAPDKGIQKAKPSIVTQKREPDGSLLEGKSPEVLAQEAKIAFEAAKEAAQKGDWAAYGSRLKELEEVLTELLQRLSETESNKIE